jgi:hypothetical protein
MNREVVLVGESIRIVSSESHAASPNGLDQTIWMNVFPSCAHSALFASSFGRVD